jgi:hypothetical protein
VGGSRLHSRVTLVPFGAWHSRATGDLVATGGDDETIRLWRAGSGALLRTLRSDRGYQRLDSTRMTGITHAQRTAMLALGAFER